MDSVQTLHEFTLNLLRDPAALAQFTNDPQGALTAAGLGDVTAADVHDVLPLVMDYAPASVVEKFGSNLGAEHLDQIAGSALSGQAGAIDQLQQITEKFSFVQTDASPLHAAFSGDLGSLATGSLAGGYNGGLTGSAAGTLDTNAVTSQLGSANVEGQLAAGQQALMTAIGDLQSGNFAGAAEQLNAVPLVGSELAGAAEQLAGAASGGFNASAVTSELGNVPLVGGQLQAGAEQFTSELSSLQSTDPATALTAGLANGQEALQTALTDLQSGNFAGAAAQLAAVPVVGPQLAGAAEQLAAYANPAELNAVTEEFGDIPVVGGQLQAGAEQITGALTGAASGHLDASAVTSELGNVPLVGGQLSAAASELGGLTSANPADALANGQAALTTAVGDLQSGNLAGAAEQLNAVPLVGPELAGAAGELAAHANPAELNAVVEEFNDVPVVGPQVAGVAEQITGSLSGAAAGHLDASAVGGELGNVPAVGGQLSGAASELGGLTSANPTEALANGQAAVTTAVGDLQSGNVAGAAEQLNAVPVVGSTLAGAAGDVTAHLGGSNPAAALTGQLGGLGAAGGDLAAVPVVGGQLQSATHELSGAANLGNLQATAGSVTGEAAAHANDVQGLTGHLAATPNPTEHAGDAAPVANGVVSDVTSHVGNVPLAGNLGGAVHNVTTDGTGQLGGSLNHPLAAVHHVTAQAPVVHETVDHTVHGLTGAMDSHSGEGHLNIADSALGNANAQGEMHHDGGHADIHFLGN